MFIVCNKSQMFAFKIILNVFIIVDNLLTLNGCCGDLSRLFKARPVSRLSKEYKHFAWANSLLHFWLTKNGVWAIGVSGPSPFTFQL